MNRPPIRRRSSGAGFLLAWLAMAFLPEAAAAGLALQFGQQPGPVPENSCLPGTYFVDLIVTETQPTENEMLFAYDLGVRLVGPGGRPGGVSLTGADRPPGEFVMGDDPAKSTLNVAENTPDSLLVNVVSNNDLFDITTGKKAARIFYTIAPGAQLGEYRVLFDPDTTVFGSGDPNRLSPQIFVSLADVGTITVCPEPGATALAGLAAVLGLRRGRRC
jgi:hypothetical protein